MIPVEQWPPYKFKFFSIILIVCEIVLIIFWFLLQFQKVREIIIRILINLKWKNGNGLEMKILPFQQDIDVLYRSMVFIQRVTFTCTSLLRGITILKLAVTNSSHWATRGQRSIRKIIRVLRVLELVIKKREINPWWPYFWYSWYEVLLIFDTCCLRVTEKTRDFFLETNM